MAKKQTGGGREMVLESRHVVGLFLMIVVISGVVFTLGYILGRNQYETQVRAAGLPPKETPRELKETAAAAKSDPALGKAQPEPPNPAPTPSDWDFYKSVETKKPADHLEKPAKNAAPATPSSAGKPKPMAVAARAPAPAAPAAKKPGSLMGAPLVPRGAIVLQVAALRQEGEALALAESLQRKKFPAFVLTPAADKYYRVQVGPYADAQSAKTAQKGLDQAGFKAILKR
jgi:cell division septation protein DedD